MKTVRFLLLIVFQSVLHAAMAAEISVGVSSQDAYVGVPITVEIQIDNASEHERPEIDDVDGLKIKPGDGPFKNSQTMIINGRRSHLESIRYRWSVTPTRKGKFIIPPIRVKADGLSSITKAIRIEATKSETGDLLLVEIEAQKDEVFVGEPIEMTLKVFVRPFVDDKQNVELNNAEMWSLFSEQTDWGPFADRLEELRINDRRPRGRLAYRKNSAGESKEYFLYQIDATIYPDRPGPIDVGDINLIMNYPVTVGIAKDRSPFDSIFGDHDSLFGGSMFDDAFFRGFVQQKRITKFRPIARGAEMESVVVRSVPTKGRPDDYRGAVGRYMIATDASPLQVTAGDPIELSIAIRGTGPMDLVQAPPLSKIDAVANDFQVSDKLLAGLVDGDRKLFRTKIRPRNENVTKIPAIPFTFFNPSTGEYETSFSSPIDIDVGAAEVLKLDRATSVADDPKVQLDQSSEVPVTTSLKPNFAWLDFQIDPGMKPLDQRSNRNHYLKSLLAWGFPPIVFACIALTRWWTNSGWRDALVTRTIRSIENSAEPAQITASLNRYLAARLRVPPTDQPFDRASMDHLLGHLRSSGQQQMAVRLERLSQKLKDLPPHEDAKATETNAVRAAAIQLVHDAKLVRRRAWANQNLTLGKSGTMASSSILFLALISNPIARADQSSRPTELSDTQGQALVKRAKSAYLAGQPSDFTNAAENLQSLVDSGIDHDAIQFNLANAQYQSGQTSRAIANYLRALRINPDKMVYRQNLLSARQSLSQSPPRWIDQFTAITPATRVRWVAIAAWLVFWATLIAGLFHNNFPWRSMACAALSVFLLCCLFMFSQRSQVVADHHAVVIKKSIELRVGDGDSFDVITRLNDVDGQLYRWNLQRGGWVNLTLPDGNRGWVRSTEVEIL